MNQISIEQCQAVAAGIIDPETDAGIATVSIFNLTGIAIGGAIGAITQTLPTAIPVTLITLNSALFFLGAAVGRNNNERT